MSWKIEVQTDSTGKWFSNGVRFESEKEAKDYMVGLSMRWTVVQDSRVAESSDPVNYRYQEGKLVNVEGS